MTNREPITAAARRLHVQILAACSLVVVLSFMLRVSDDRKVSFHGAPLLPLPQMCLSRSWFGFECPGCGLTRSFVCLAHGDWTGAWKMHRLGWLIALAVLLQFPYRIYALVRKQAAPLGTRIPQYFAVLLIVSLLGNWLCRWF